MKPSIYLIRHTRPVLSQEYCYGGSDIELSADFEEEAAKISFQLEGFEPEIVYASPLKRCAQLAEKLFAPIEIKYEKRFEEMNFGEWEGKKWKEIDRKSLDYWADNFETAVVPKGEGLADFHERVITAWNEIDLSKKMAIVAHAGTIRMILNEILGIPLTKVFSLSMKYGQVIKLSPWGNGDFSVEFL